MVVFDKPKAMSFERMADKQMHYCPGCMHGAIHRLVAEVLDELELEGKTVGVAPVGCSVFAYAHNYKFYSIAYSLTAFSQCAIGYTLLKQKNRPHGRLSKAIMLSGWSVVFFPCCVPLSRRARALPFLRS